MRNKGIGAKSVQIFKFTFKMSREKPTMSIPKSPSKTNKRTTASEEINVITQVTAEAERLKEQNNKLREEMDELKRQLGELKASGENRPGKSEEIESEEESETLNPREKVNQTRENHTNNAVNNNVLGNVRLPRGRWLMDPFAQIKFKGKEDSQNPIKFLKKFEKIAEYENIDMRDQLHYFKKCMRGNANNWLEVYDPVNIEEAKESFREYFWGDEQQVRFRENLCTGRYRIEKGESMGEYTMNLARQAKYLEPPMSDHEIIRCIKRHFGSDVTREIKPSTARTISELATLLEDIEYEKKVIKQNKKLNANDSQVNARKSYENRQRTGAYREIAPRRFNEQYQRYGPEKGFETYAVGNQRKKWPEENRGNRQSSVQITELPNSDEENESKKVVRYQKDAIKNRERER